MEKFISDVVEAHNTYRKLHGQVGALTHNPELSRKAQSWANHLASTMKLAHSNDTYKGQPLGENVASKASSAGADYTGQQVVDQWYSEIKKYDFRKTHVQQPGTGHFTQVVWKSSQEIGIGKAFCDNNRRVFVVANYSPAGNFANKYAENIFPPKK